MKPHAQHLKELARIFSSMQNEKESELLLSDILTPQEIESLAERWSLIRELAAGTPQREIAKKLNISISKITRGSRQLKYGTGGFELLLKRANKETERAPKQDKPEVQRAVKKHVTEAKSKRRWALFGR